MKSEKYAPGPLNVSLQVDIYLGNVICSIIKGYIFIILKYWPFILTKTKIWKIFFLQKIFQKKKNGTTKCHVVKIFLRR